ncbi:hypothetical protein BT1A1_0574 [Caldibacillus thermoamylovorans]|uniref:DUF5082 domain-containing protein n=1 Tax=Caldibacillus thermoamylovorans TaxID=35841 RepID=A0A090KP60_9BACI|nr:hypothetical protein [Caldibacillus thermoamylovorans]MCM3056542.1 hypothetical protein [Caldibacillus thermoamylovorans]CEE00429.1 hypothetical protein BT1A1_0574 [Caldibacillus thermoamylovorans]
MELLDEIEKKVQRGKFLLMVEILEGYRSNVHQAVNRIDGSLQMYRSADSSYAKHWEGETRNKYEEITAEIQHIGNKIDQQGDRLINAINKEIRSLLAKCEALR